MGPWRGREGGRMWETHTSWRSRVRQRHGAEPHNSLKTGDLRGLERTLEHDCRRARVYGGLSTLRLQRLGKKFI